MKKFVTAVEETENKDTDRGPAIEYELDGRKMRAYRPHDGQLTFMMATLGRGQTDDQRYSSVVNLLLKTHEKSDADYLESRLLEEDDNKRLHLKQLEEIFEYLAEEWFADPTQSPSASAESESNGSQNSLPPTP